MLSIRFRLARSNGLYGASTGASRAPPTHSTTSKVDTIATGDRRKL